VDVPSEPSSIDLNADGVLDYAYFGDMLGQMWRLDLRTEPPDHSLVPRS